MVFTEPISDKSVTLSHNKAKNCSMNNRNEEIDVLIIGAGPSGTVAAGVLNKNGVSTKIIEKQSFPRFVIGESLLPRCMDNLEKAGLLEVVKHQNFQEKFGAKFIDKSKNCDFDFSEQFSEGWGWTWQVKRAQFDQVLAQEIEKRGVPIAYNTEVTDVHFDQNGTSTTTINREDGSSDTITAKHIIDASGYGRVLPRLLQLDVPSNFPVRTSLFCHIKDLNRPTGADGNRITIVVYKQDVWIWIIPFSDNITSVGVVGSPEDINRFKGGATDQFKSWISEVPELADRFNKMDYIFEPKQITGYSSAVSKLYGDGYTLTGNSTEFLDPVFSSGVTFATESGALAAELITRTLKGENVDWETEYSEYIKRGVDVFRSFIMGWYDGTLQKIFFTKKENELMKKQICSVLAGYVWDLENPFVKQHARALKALADVL